MTNHEIHLVNMPLASVVRPSLALGLLKAVLKRDGMSARVHNATLDWIEFSGPANHPLLLATRNEECVLDWMFSKAAFPDFEAPEEEFLDLLATNHPKTFEEQGEKLRRRLCELRRQTPDFIDSLAQRILASEPKIVGCTSSFQQHIASLALLRRIRALAPEVVTMMGGANCETIMGRTTHEEFPWVDFVVSGEADHVISPLCRTILTRGAHAEADAWPPAVFAPIHRKHGYPQTTSGDGVPRAISHDLNAQPLPDFDDYFERDLPAFLYADQIAAGIPYEASRGCWWGERSHCTFCGLNGGGMNFRAKSAEKIRCEIEALSARHGITRIETVDNIIDMDLFDSLLPEFAEREEKFTLFWETKANLRREQIERFHDAGVRWVQPGIETLDSEILRLIGKGASAWQNLQFLKWCRQYGIHAFWNVIAGFPGEEDRHYAGMMAILPAIEHFQPGNFSELRYDRYSPYFENAEEYGLELRPCRQFEMVYPLSRERLADLVYFFTDPSRRLAEKLRTAGHESERAVHDFMLRWRRRWPDGPRLEWIHEDGEPECSRVLDERACTPATEHRVSPLEKAVLAACDSAIPETRLPQVVARPEAATPGDLEAAVARLLELRLVLRVDGRILALVLDRPETPPLGHEFPGGSFIWPPASGARAAFLPPVPGGDA